MTKVEEVARAINAAIGDGDASLEASKAFAERLARAAIKALRIPSEEMLAAVVKEPTHLYGQEGRGADYQRDMNVAVAVDRLVLKQRYERMIDAALGETDE